MLERRQFQRLSVKLPAKIRIFDPEAKTDITNDVDVYTKDISRAGMCLVLPRGWDCPDCNNCLGWMYNLTCKLKNNFTMEANRVLASKLNLKISIADPSDPLKEPVQLEASCAWVKADIAAEEENYPVGVSLSAAGQKNFLEFLSGIFDL